MESYEVILKGKVQGVGMRYFIKRVAPKFGITGFVKNQKDGTVYALLNQSEELVNEFINYVKDNAPGIIERIEKYQVETKIEYRKFSVKLW